MIIMNDETQDKVKDQLPEDQTEVTNDSPEEESSKEETPVAETNGENTELTQLDPAQAEETKENIISVIKTIFDPEIPVNIYELGLIYEVNVLPLGNVTVVMTLTSPNCPVAGSLPAEVETKIKSIPGVNNVDLDLTFDPPWDMEMMSDEAKLELGMF